MSGCGYNQTYVGKVQDYNYWSTNPQKQGYGSKWAKELQSSLMAN